MVNELNENNMALDKSSIVMCYLTQEDISKGRPFAHFGWEGKESFSFTTIADGYWESGKILLKEMNNNSNSIDILDTLIYPLFFNYRHSIEAYLKALFFSYGEQTDGARRKFLNIGHDLENLWNNLMPSLHKGVKHVGSSIDLSAVEHYIKSINEFDENSMMMRYPIDKDLNPNKKQEYRLDFIAFGKHMNELCNSLRQLDYDLSNQMTEVATVEELSEYLDILKKYRNQIDSFLSLLRNQSIEEPTEINFFSFENLISEIDKYKLSPCNEFLMSCDSDLYILLDNLYYAGRSVNENTVRLSTSPVTRQKEFVKFCYELLSNNGLSFGSPPKSDQLNIKGKQASSLISGISKSLSILSLNG